MTIELNEGEIYVGAIIGPDGSGNHIILLPGDNGDADWKTQMEWAKSIGGDLPDCVELALLYKRHSGQFKKDVYWSGEEHASYSGYAWYQGFISGYQNYSTKSSKLRARAVRRLVI